MKKILLAGVLAFGASAAAFAESPVTLSTDGNITYYLISNPRQYVSYLVSDNSQISQKASIEHTNRYEPAAVWYFKAAETTEQHEGFTPVQIFNLTKEGNLITIQATYSTTETKVWWIANEQSSGTGYYGEQAGYVISPDGTQNNCWNDKDRSYVTTWSGNDDGSKWNFTIADDSRINATLDYLKDPYTDEAKEIATKGNSFKDLGLATTSTITAFEQAAAETDWNETKYNALISAYTAMVNSTSQLQNAVSVTFPAYGNGRGSDYLGVYASTGQPMRLGNESTDNRVWTLKPTTGGFKLYNEYNNAYLQHKNLSDNGYGVNLTLVGEAEGSTYVFTLHDALQGGYGVKCVDSNIAENAKFIHAQTNDVVSWTSGNNSAWFINLSDEATAASQNLKGAISRNDKSIGTNYGQWTVTGVDNFTELINTAKSKNNDTTEATEKRAAASALNTAMESATLTFNAPQPGKFYRIQCVNGNKYLTSVPKDATQNINGQNVTVQSLTTEAIDANNLQAKTIWYLDENMKLVAFNGGTCIKYGTSSKNWSLVTESEASTVQFVESNAVPGKLNIVINGNRYIYGKNGEVDSGDNNARDFTDDGYLWNVTDATWLPIPTAATTTGDFHPLYLPVPLYKTDNDNGAGATRVTAYKVVRSGGYAVKSQITGNIIPANTPVLLQCTQAPQDGHIWLQVAPDASAQAQIDEDNHLSGSIYATTKADTHSYFTVANGDTPKFVAHTADETIPGFTAHLAVETANANAAGYTLVDAVPTAIEAVESAANDSETWYDLQGHRVNAPAHGFFINANGRKVIR